MASFMQEGECKRKKCSVGGYGTTMVPLRPSKGAAVVTDTEVWFKTDFV